jgi:DNA polymerase elongation subunit (family B)
MIEAWCDWVREINPTIVTGHNIYAYDLPYINFIASKYNVAVNLGRDNSSLSFDTYQSRFRKDQTQFIEYYRPKIYGRSIVDTLFLSIKYDTVAKKYESYALKKIIEAEGIVQEGRVFYDASQIRYKYKEYTEWLKIKAYAMYDGDDALALYDLFSPPYFYMTQSVPKSFQSIIESASGSQINSIMVRSYLQEMYSLPKAHEQAAYEGAISIGNPGIYSNCFKVDVSSLYPNIMLQYEVYDKDKDPNKNFLQLVQTFTARRLEHKKLAKTDKYYDDLQAMEKIFINSCYGFLGTAGLLFNSPMKASFVTETGRNILQQSIKWAEDKSFKIVNADTDSIMFNHEDGRDMSSDHRKTLLDDLNSKFPDRIKFEDDGYFSKVIVFKPKNYVLWDGKKLKTKGSSLKASQKEGRLKDFIKDVIQYIIDDKQPDLVNLYNKYAIESQTLTSISGWVFKKGISNKVMINERANEAKVRDAIAGTEIAEGDKCYMFFMPDETLCLEENFTGEYHKDKLLEKLYKTMEIFDTVIDMAPFLNYKLKRNKKALQELLDKR